VGKSVVKLEQEKGYKIMGMSLLMFAIITIIVLTATYMEVLPTGMIGAFPLMMVVGAILNEIGDRAPIIKDFLGGGAIVVIFGSAALVTFNLIPESSITIMTNFMKSESFLDFYIAALITGSILGMDRKLLVKAAIRYLPCILGGVIAALGLAGILGAILGFGAKEAILFIAIPIMGGGMGAGAVPLAQIFGEGMKTDPTTVLSMMVPAVALGNAISIVAGGLLNRLGRLKPSLAGHGKLMVDQEDPEEDTEDRVEINYRYMGIGLLTATSFFVWGRILAKFIPLHSYALMIISVAIVKAIGILPRKYEVACFQWYQFIMTNLTPTLLVGIGVAYTNLAEVAAAFTPSYLALVTVTVIGAILGAGFVGKLLGFYPIEASITAGLCMSNMGGTGDVAVLSAADRMHLMPFAQISSRIGGAFMLLLASGILGFLA